MKFETVSGSTYEVDQEAKRIRRLSGTRPAQPRQGNDGEWKDYEALSPIEVGSCLVIAWPRATTALHPGSPSYAMPSTITSPVTVVTP
jgi:hypothetical protein